MPEDTLIEDRNLLMHPFSQVHKNAERSQFCDVLTPFFNAANTGLIGRAGQDMDTNAPHHRKAERVRQTSDPSARDEGRENHRRLTGMLEVFDKRRKEVGMTKRAGRSFRQFEVRRQDAMETVDPVLLDERKHGVGIERLAMIREVIDKPASEALLRRFLTEIHEIRNQDEVTPRTAHGDV